MKLVVPLNPTQPLFVNKPVNVKFSCNKTCALADAARRRAVKTGARNAENERGRNLENFVFMG